MPQIQLNVPAQITITLNEAGALSFTGPENPILFSWMMEVTKHLLLAKAINPADAEKRPALALPNGPVDLSKLRGKGAG